MILDKQSSSHVALSNAGVGTPVSYPLQERSGRVTGLIRRLSDTGHRITPQRLSILQALVGSDNHPSAEEVYNAVLEHCPTTSRGTVYKTLQTLKDLGEVVELEFRDGCNRYDARRPDEHPHAVCTRCARIEDVDLAGLAELNERAGHQSGFRISAHRLDFYGLCRDCQESS